MKQSSSFARKVTYIAIIGSLMIPLSLVSRPATRDEKNAISDPGGILSDLRDKNELSQAQLSEIDPGSETMKLASLGFRGFAVNLLWMKAIDAKSRKQWDTFSSTLNSLVKIQPNFIKVWEFQSHNLSYNTAPEFDDYEQRYRWVKKGIEFLTTGIKYNRRDHRIVDNLGFFTGNKIGTADERVQYRSLFRDDSNFHDQMGNWVDVNGLDTPYGADNWLLAYQWYDRSQRMVEQGIGTTGRVRLRGKEMLFYNNKPTQLRNMGLSLQSEFRSDEFMVENWRRAHEELLDYGRRKLSVSGDIGVSLDSLKESSDKIQSLRRQLDRLVPGERERLLAEKLQLLSDEQRLILNQPVESMTDSEFEEYKKVQYVVYGSDLGIDQQISQLVPRADQGKVAQIMAQMSEEAIKVSMGNFFRDTVNFDHWKLHTKVESSPDGINARQAEYDAYSLRDDSVFDEYQDRDPVTGATKTLPGSIQKFDDSFESWARVCQDYPQLRIGPLMDDVTLTMQDYRTVREVAGEDDWPSDFVMQDVIDYRADRNGFDELPLSSELEERSAGRNKEIRYRIPAPPNINFTYDEPSEKDQ